MMKVEKGRIIPESEIEEGVMAALIDKGLYGYNTKEGGFEQTCQRESYLGDGKWIINVNIQRIDVNIAEMLNDRNFQHFKIEAYVSYEYGVELDTTVKAFESRQKAFERLLKP